MVNAMNAAITAKAAGISVCLVSLTAFNGPTNRALGRGIPGLSYNKDAPNAGWPTSARISTSPASAWASESSTSSAAVTSHSSSRRRDSSTSSRGSTAPSPRSSSSARARSRPRRLRPARSSHELAKIDAYYLGHEPQGGVRGRLRLDGGRRQGHAEVRLEQEGRQGRRLRPGPPVLRAIQGGRLDFTIDQQPYLQGWLPVLQLFLLQVLVGACGPVGHEHGHPVRHEGEREAVPDDEDPLRGSSSKQKYPVTQPG